MTALRQTMIAVLLYAAITLQAQTQPQLVWEGEVDGTSVIHVRGDRLDIEDRGGASAQRDRHRFHERLPELRQTVDVRRLQGRGNVRVIRQPDASNNFTLSVRIEDRMGGRDFYSLAFYWETASRAPIFDQRRGPSPGRSLGRGEERLTWTGYVDDEVNVECRGNECRPQTIRGAAAQGDRFSFTRPLPALELRTSLDDVQGRGEVQLVNQPAAHNGYTAKVRIRDSQGGSGEYAFSLYWVPPSRSEPERLFASQGLVWSGRVDGIVRVVVEGSSASVQVLGGGPVEGERANFLRPLPNQAVPNVAVKKLRGRGRVNVVEFPSARNGWRLVFEVNDSSGGADNYEIEVGW
jgi:hypothetical protein